jgi:hypothetical protein
MITTGAQPDTYDPRLWEPVKSAPAYDPKLWEPVKAEASPELTLEQAEAEREKIEGPGPELEDAPIANAMIAGAASGGVGALREGATEAFGSFAGPDLASLAVNVVIRSLAEGVDWGAFTILSDWGDKLIGGPLKNHPYLREALDVAGGVGLAMKMPSASRLPGLRLSAAEAERGADVLHRLAEHRALAGPEEEMAGTATDLFEEPPAPKAKEPVEFKPEQEVREPEPPKEIPQPKEDIQQAVAAGDTASAKEGVLQELERHPSAQVYEMKVGDMKRDPERFQYKKGTDPTTGAGAALGDIKTYDRGLGGVITMYHDPDGQFYVANGHQRVDALERLEGPEASHRVQIIESRPADDPEATKGAIRYGQTPEQARSYGAIINIAEGRGTAMDAARFFRSQGMDTSTMIEHGISLDPREEKTLQAAALSQLSPMVFRAVDHGVLPQRLGVVIGRELGDNPTAQDALYQMLKKRGFRDMGASKLGEMLRLAKGAGETTETTMTLFGPETMKKSLLMEQADVLAGIKSRLASEKRLFGTVAGGAEQIEEAGVGKVDADTGEHLSTVAAQNLELLGRTAYGAGPVNDAIKDAAKKLAEGKTSKSAIIKEAYQKVADELGKIIPEAPQQRELIPAKFVEPAEPEPVSAAEPKEPEPVDMYSGLPVAQIARNVVDALPENVRNYPAQIGKQLVRTFAPETDGAFAKRATEIQESKASELRARIGSASRAMRPLRAWFDSQPESARYQLSSALERGDSSALPDELKPFGSAMKQITDAAHDRLNTLRPDQEVGYINNYWRHLWANKPEEVRDAFESLKSGGGKALTAGKGFLKQRKFPTMAEGIQAGLTPKFKNPVDMWLAGVQQEWRYQTGTEMFNALKDSGLTHYVRVAERPPKGWAKIDDSVARVLAPTEKGIAQLGEYYAPEEVARIFNNYLSPGSGLNPLISLSAAGNRLRVEFSAFHFMLTSLSNMAGQVGDQFMAGVGDLMHGDTGAGMLKIATTPLKVLSSPLQTYRDWKVGKNVIAKALDGRFEDPMVQDAMLGGHDFGMGDHETGSAIGAASRGVLGWPAQLAEKFGAVMKHWVSPLKIGTAMRMYGAKLDEAARENGDQALSMAERRTIAVNVRRHMDNVMGMIHRDNLHFSNGMKDALHMVVAYPGWQIGSIRLTGGAARGIATGLRGGEMDEQAAMALRYVSGMIITSGTLGTITNYLMTGRMPRSVSEVFLWPTGKKDANGNDVRIVPPEYLVRDYLSTLGHRRTQPGNDIMAWPKALGETALSKMNWPLAAAGYIMRNADYFGKPISFPDLDSQPQSLRNIVNQIVKYGETIGKEVEPFSMSNYEEAKRQGVGGIRTGLAAGIGMTPESRVLRQTPAQNFIDRFKTPSQQPQSPDQQQRQQILGQFEADLRRARQGGAPVNFGPIKDALAKGLVTTQEIKEREADARLRPFASAVKKQNIGVALQAWKLAHDNGDTQDENDAARAIFAKLRNKDLQKLPPDQQAQARGLLTRFLKAATGREESAEARP